MIFGVPLDGMHMGHLGATKKLLKDIRKGTIHIQSNINSQHRLTNNLISELSRLILKCKEQIPKVEYRSRRGQSLDDLPNWKAIEYRLYRAYCLEKSAHS